MSNQNFWLTTTAKRSGSVLCAYAPGVRALEVPSTDRGRFGAITMAAHKATGPRTWSPPPR